MQVAIIAGAGNGIGPILAVADGPTEVHQVQVAKALPKGAEEIRQPAGGLKEGRIQV